VPAESNDSKEIDLHKLWNVLWQGKVLIIAITSVFAIASVWYALFLPNEYRSTALLAPSVQSSGAGGLAQLAGQFGGLASLAGINIGGGSEDKSVVAMEIIKTWGFLETFIEDNDIAVEVYAAKGWNSATNKLVIDPDIYDTVNNKWVEKSNTEKGSAAKPSSWKLFEEMKDKVLISQDKNSGLINLSVEHFSPQIAKDWTDRLVKAINSDIQRRDREEASKSIDYLNKKIEETTNSDMQVIFYQLIEEQTKTLMLAEVSNEYVFKTISQAKVAEVRVKPKRALIVVLGVFLGGMLSILIVLIRNFQKYSRID
jgi:uncharacterized protein involved in exopolysaccharide biosynthesis